MEIELFSVFALCALVYILARMVTWVAAEKEQAQLQRIEKERLEKIDSLYGRDKR